LLALMKCALVFFVSRPIDYDFLAAHQSQITKHFRLIFRGAIARDESRHLKIAVYESIVRARMLLLVFYPVQLRRIGRRGDDHDDDLCVTGCASSHRKFSVMIEYNLRCRAPKL